MSAVRFLIADALPEFLAGLAKSQEGERQVLVPTRQGKGMVFAPYDAGAPLCFDKTQVPPKGTVLPQSDSLFTWSRVKDPEDLGKTSLKLNDNIRATPTVVFGCRPCDARGFTVLDRPYLQGPHRDPYYAKKRDTLLVITRACTETCSTCFCHWVGSGPADTDGSDILFTEVQNSLGQSGFALQAVTQKGQEALQKSGLAETEGLQAAVTKAHADACQSLGDAPDLTGAADAIAARFTDMDFWQKHTAACLSCGACTYMCPTCYCFNITDEGDGLGETQGKRLRTWDNCMASHFTREASGHNPRTLKAQRMRNRVSHKFSNYPKVWDKVFSCNGCGRCISQCPVHIDIRAMVLAALKD